MKLSLLFVAILGVATVSAVPAGKVLTRSSSLADDLEDFKALLPVDKILEIFITYLAEDEQVGALVVYVLSEDFKNLVIEVDAIPEYISFLDYLQSAGLDVYKWVNQLHGLLGLDALPVPKSLSVSGLVTRSTGGVAGLVADIKAVLPLKELRALHEEKLETSDAYADLVRELNSPEAKIVYNKLKANKEYQHIRESLSTEYGLDIEHIFDIIKELIGWN